jgi:hypothetical protein
VVGKYFCKGCAQVLLLLIKNEKSLRKDTKETFHCIFETETGATAETFFPLVTCTTLERAKMVRLATPGRFLPYKREISTHYFYCPCNTKHPTRRLDKYRTHY